MLFKIYGPLVLRHLLTMLGAIIVSRGILDASTVETVVGSLMAAASVTWSYLEKPTMVFKTFLGLVVRHIMSAVGAILIKFGWADAQTVAAITGLAVSLATMTWAGANRTKR